MPQSIYDSQSIIRDSRSTITIPKTNALTLSLTGFTLSGLKITFAHMMDGSFPLSWTKPCDE